MLYAKFSLFVWLYSLAKFGKTTISQRLDQYVLCVMDFKMYKFLIKIQN